MSTRGLWGFVVDGQEKLTYNHCDSYPGGLGAELVKVVKNRLRRRAGVEGLRLEAHALRVVRKADVPTREDIERLRPWTDLNVSTRSTNEWYCLLRRTQGDLDATLAAGAMIDGHNFATDSLFCEYGYVIDLDAERFEVYRGFQKAPHTEGRFHALPANREGQDPYYPIRLVTSWPLAEIPRDWHESVDPVEYEDES